MKLIVEYEIEDWWGIDELLEDLGDKTKQEKEQQIIELLKEDVCCILENSIWKIEGL